MKLISIISLISIIIICIGIGVFFLFRNDKLINTPPNVLADIQNTTIERNKILLILGIIFLIFIAFMIFFRKNSRIPTEGDIEYNQIDVYDFSKFTDFDNFIHNPNGSIPENVVTYLNPQGQNIGTDEARIILGPPTGKDSNGNPTWTTFTLVTSGQINIPMTTFFNNILLTWNVGGAQTPGFSEDAPNYRFSLSLTGYKGDTNGNINIGYGQAIRITNTDYSKILHRYY